MVTNGVEKSGPQGPPRPQAAVLVVDADQSRGELLAASAVRYFDGPALVAASIEQSRAVLDDANWPHPRVVLADMRLPDGDGSDLLLMLERKDVPAVAVVTAAPSFYWATVALRTRVADFLVRPFTDEQLTATFERLSRRLAQHDEQCRLREQAEHTARFNQHLRMKIDILCKDLVSGYQRLVARMANR